MGSGIDLNTQLGSTTFNAISELKLKEKIILKALKALKSLSKVDQSSQNFSSLIMQTSARNCLLKLYDSLIHIDALKSFLLRKF